LDPIDGTVLYRQLFLVRHLIALERDEGTGFRPVLGANRTSAAGLALIGHSEECRLFSADGR